MVDNEILVELRQIVEKNGDTQITQKTLNKLVLAAVAETLSKVEELGENMERMLDEIRHNEKSWHEKRDQQTASQDKLLEEMKQSTQSCQDGINLVGAQVQSIDRRLLQVEQNIIIKAGNFANKHPKEAIVVFAIIVAIVSLWDLRGLILHLLGLPTDIIVTPVITPTSIP